MSAAKREEMPLLPLAEQKTTPVRHKSIRIEEDKEYWEDDFNEDDILFSDGKRRGTSLLLNDAVIIILEYLQYFGLIASLSLRWPWPSDWLSFCRYEFLINLDIWEFIKLQGNTTYKNVQGYYSPSANMGISYWYICLGWAILFTLLGLSYLITYLLLEHRKHPFMLVRVARLQQVFIVILQVIALPIGIAAAKVFHYTDKYQVDIDNTLDVFGGIHWVYVSVSVFFAMLMYILFPAWLIYKTKKEILSKSSDRHEAYLQMKETEYVQGLDVIYIVSGFHIFSSFKRIGAHYRATSHIIKLVIISVYAALFQYTFIQAMILTIIFSVLTAAFVIIRPFRVSIFNYMLWINCFCLAANCLIGSMQSSFDSYTLRSPWFTPTYIYYIMIFVNGLWLFCCLIFLLYMLAHQFCRCCKDPLWPTMTSHGLSKLNPDTRRYMRAILRARHLLEKCLKMPPIFAPAHELTRQIQIINAYCREAEYLKDPIHGTLWDLLDELIEAHAQIAPKSLFADSIKDSIRQTASELMTIMPMFVRRLAQREYDFILMTPVKRRLLLKMYCLGTFLNGRPEKIKKNRINDPNINKLWGKDGEVDDGYYEDMYPEQLQGPNYRPVSAVTVVSVSSKYEREDEDYLLDLEQWTAAHPSSRMGSRAYSNSAFESDGVSALLRDDDEESVGLNSLLQGVPSLPSSRPSSKDSSRPKSSQSVRSEGRPSSSGSQRPTSGMMRPAGRAESPLDRPGSAGSRPGSAVSQRSQGQRPGPGGQRPGSTASQRSQGQRPGSAVSQGSRPRSGQTERPASGKSHDSEDQRPESSYKRPGSAGSGTHSEAAEATPGGLEPLVEVLTPRDNIPDEKNNSTEETTEL